MARIVVMGAGAVGAYYGACLQRGGHELVFVARGANLDALRDDGLHVTGAMGEFTLDDVVATDNPDDAGTADLVLLAVKNYDLDDAAHAVRGLRAICLTLQNGVDAPSVARAVLGDAVIAGSTGIVADLAEPGHVDVVSSYAWIRFGEPEGGGVSERVAEVGGWLACNGIEPIAVDDVRISLWEKMALMCGMAGLTTLHQRPIGDILTDRDLRRAFESIVAECEDVARVRGVPLPEDFFEERIGYAQRIDPSAMSSMSRDFARGRRIELETFNGAIVRIGAEVGVDVPTNRRVYEELAARS